MRKEHLYLNIYSQKRKDNWQNFTTGAPIIKQAVNRILRKRGSAPYQQMREE